jgi:uncharacterized membrane protein
VFRCIICGFTTELDDAVVTGTNGGRCICLRCFARETHDEKRMPARLRRELTAALAMTVE